MTKKGGNTTVEKPVEATVGKYPVEDYLNMLRLAKRSENTITGYKKVLKSYADFLNVPLDEIHAHISVSNLLKYAGSRKGRSDAGTKNVLSILHRYFQINGVVFDELQYNAMKPKVVKEHNDKPLELETLQKMMDLTDPHGRAILSFLISTGCRADEMCNIHLSDLHGDCVIIRNEIAKNGHGGRVYLTREAQEYLDLWLKDRDDYIRIADARMKGLAGKKNPHPAKPRPANDPRVFAISYTSLHRIFSRLYDKVDGSRGKYRAECTVHSCRKYFRTHAAQTMHPDLVTGLMRQTGYLDSTYVRMSDEDRKKRFHDGEAALYITRVDHRIQSGELNVLKDENAGLQERLAAVETETSENILLKKQVAMMAETMSDMQKIIKGLSKALDPEGDLTKKILGPEE